MEKKEEKKVFGLRCLHQNLVVAVVELKLKR